MEKQVEKFFVKVNQVWQKGEIVSKNESILKIKTQDGLEFNIDQTSPYVEKMRFPAQRFAFAEAKEKMEGAYISFDKLPENIQDALVKGEEYIHRSTYVNEGQLKEIIKAVQLLYSSRNGSKLDVQIKRNEPVKLEQAKAFNHQFTKEEFESMVNNGKSIVFNGVTKDGELFPKLAYYEPRLNDIRTKSALTGNTYFYGQQLTAEQADALNKGESVKISIATKKGRKTYNVTYSPRAERFITKSPEKDKAKELEVKDAVVVGNEKKKNLPNVLSR
jgi:hypothetical protein